MNNKSNVSQTLLFPLKFNFSQTDFNILFKLKETLSHLGFIFEKFTKNEIEVSGIHPVFKHDGLDLFFNEMIENEILEYENHSSSVNDHLAKLICFSKSVKINHLMNEKEQILLTNQLFACKDSKFSPDKKKIYVSITEKEINNRFK